MVSNKKNAKEGHLSFATRTNERVMPTWMHLEFSVSNKKKIICSGFRFENTYFRLHVSSSGSRNRKQVSIMFQDSAG